MQTRKHDHPTPHLSHARVAHGGHQVEQGDRVHDEPQLLVRQERVESHEPHCWDQEGPRAMVTVRAPEDEGQRSQ